MSDWTVSSEERVGRFKVSVVYDDQHRLSDAVNDEPVMIFESDSRGYGYSYSEILDQSKRNFPARNLLRMIADDKDDSELLNEFCDMDSSCDWRATDSGTIRAEHGEWIKPRYFKTKAAAFAAMFKAEYGRSLSDLKVESFRSSVYQSGGTYYLTFWQSELDEYAGVKDAVSCLSACESIVDGEVYGFVISGPYDQDGEESGGFDDHLDSCWGFIGDESYCMGEGKSAAEWLENKAAEKDAMAFAAMMETARPDLAPQYEADSPRIVLARWGFGGQSV